MCAFAGKAFPYARASVSVDPFCGETLALFIRFWLTVTPPLPEAEQMSARAKGMERFEGFMQSLGSRLATGDRFLKELSRDVVPSDFNARKVDDGDE